MSADVLARALGAQVRAASTSNARAITASRRGTALVPIPAAMASPPTIGFAGPGGSSPIASSQLIAYSSTAISLLAAVPLAVTQFSITYTGNGANGSWARPPFVIEFDHYGSQFALRYRDVAGSASPSGFWLWVDGVPAGAPVTATSNAPGSLFRMVANFSVAAHRRIRLYLNNADYGGLEIESTGFVSPVANAAPVLAWLGDSWCEGTGQLASPFLSIAGYLGLALQYGPAMRCGQGGTGWIATGGTAGKAVFGDSARIAALVAGRPDIVLVQGSINDNGQSAAAITAAVQAGVSRLRAALPGTRFYALGVQPTTAAPAAAALANNAAFFAGIDAVGGMTKIDPITEGWMQAGMVASVIGADGVHPNDTGARYFGRRLAERIVLPG